MKGEGFTLDKRKAVTFSIDKAETEEEEYLAYKQMIDSVKELFKEVIGIDDHRNC